MSSRTSITALAAAVAFAATTASFAAPAASIGKPAPDFTLTTLDGDKITLADLKGQVVVLNYWATWCGPCRLEMPMFDIYLRAHPNQGLRIFSISTEGSAPAYRLHPLAKILAMQLVTRLSGHGYGTLKNAVPTNYLIDRAGVVRAAQAGSYNEASFDAAVAPLLAEPKPGG